MVEKKAALTFYFYLTFNISMHILHTVLYTHPKMLTRRICLKSNSFFRQWSSPLLLLQNLKLWFKGGTVGHS